MTTKFDYLYRRVYQRASEAVDDNMLSSDFLVKLSEIHSYSVFQNNGVFEIQFMLDD